MPQYTGSQKMCCKTFSTHPTMSIEGHERSGKQSGRAANGRSPGSSCHEYKLSIHEPGLLSRQCTCLFQNEQSIGVTKSPCQVFFYVFSIAPVQRVRYKRGGGRAHGECPAADDGTTARETERTQKRYTPYRYRAVKY